VSTLPAIPVHRPLTRPRTLTLFATLLFSDVSGWVQLLVTTWLLLRGPHPAVWLTVFFAARSVPKFVASPFAGSIADHVDRVLLYRASRFLAVLPPVGLAIAASSVVPRTEAIITVAALGSVLAALDQPARRGLLWDLSGPGRILGTVSLSSAAFHCAASLAPALAVLLVGSLGSTGALNVTVLIAAASAVCAWSFTRLNGERPIRQREVTDRRALCGIQYLLRNHHALLLVALTGAPGLVGRGLAIAIPAVAGSHAHASLTGGALASAPGAGAFVAAVALAVLGEISDKSRFALLCVVAFALCLLLAPVAPFYYGELLLLAMAGACSASFGTVIASMLHLHVPDHLRCRVLAF
jgi:MFS family permease